MHFRLPLVLEPGFRIEGILHLNIVRSQFYSFFISVLHSPLISISLTLFLPFHSLIHTFLGIFFGKMRRLKSNADHFRSMVCKRTKSAIADTVASTAGEYLKLITSLGESSNWLGQVS